MVETPSRRAVLRASAGVAAASLAGCLFENEQTQGSVLFLENTKGTEQVVQLVVSEGEEITDDRAVDAWYRIPYEVALELHDVLEDGQTYTIGVRAADEEPDQQVAVTVEPCDEDAEGSRDVSVRIRDDSNGVIPWDCGEEYTRRELEYEDAEDHRVDAPDDPETWTSPSQ